MRKSLFAVVPAVGLGLLMVAPAGAGVVFSADFEAPTYLAGVIPDASTPQVLVDFGGWSTYKFPDIGTGILGKPTGQTPQWAAAGYSSNPSEVGDDWLNDAFVGLDPANSSNQVAGFIGSSSQGPVNASGASVLVNLNTTDDVILSLKAYWPSSRNAGGTPVAVMGFMNTSLNFGNSAYFGNGNLAFTFNGQNHEVTPDAWHAAVLTIHPATSTADFSVDGVTVVSGASVNLGGFSGPAKFNVYMDDPEWPGDRGNGAIFMDDVQIVQVPEPATLSILTLAGAGVLLRRRK